jgi:hypothetical protein
MIFGIVYYLASSYNWACKNGPYLRCEFLISFHLVLDNKEYLGVNK